MAKCIVSQGPSLEQYARELTKNMRFWFLYKKYKTKSEIQVKKETVHITDQDPGKLLYSLHREVESMWREMLSTYIMEDQLKQIYLVITPVLLLFYMRKNQLEILVGGSYSAESEVSMEMEGLGKKWENNFLEEPTSVYGMNVFTGGRWLRFQRECIKFTWEHLL